MASLVSVWLPPQWLGATVKRINSLDGRIFHKDEVIFRENPYETSKILGCLGHGRRQVFREHKLNSCILDFLRVERRSDFLAGL